MPTLDPLDWLVIIIYFIITYIVAIWSVRYQENMLSTSAGYFLAGRNTGWFVIGSSLFASHIGAEHLVGLAGSGSVVGVATANFEIISSFVLILLAWFFVPVYIKSSVYTMPEFLERRYSPVARWYLAVISIIGYVLTKISVTIAAGAMVLEALTGVHFWLAALIVVVVTGIYTIFGGLRAVLYTDMLQMFVFLIGGITVTWFGLDKIGGWGQMHQIAGPDFMSIWKPLSNPHFPWLGIILGTPILAIWYWCTDQFIIQRVLAAAGIDEGRNGAIFTGFLKLLPLFIFVIPGVIAYCLTKKGLLQLDSPDQALPALIAALLPSGLRGLVIAGVLAALMSSLSAVFSACSSVITLDIYKKLRPAASERHLVLIGQLATVVLIILGILWVPFMKLISGQIFQYLQMVQAYIAPPVAAVFLIGLLWPRMNGKGAVTALFGGFIVGIGRLIAELNKAQWNHGWIHYMLSINYLYFAVLLFIFSSILLVMVSLSTAAQPREKLMNLTVQTTLGDYIPYARTRVASLVFSILLIALIFAIWLYFR